MSGGVDAMPTDKPPILGTNLYDILDLTTTPSTAAYLLGRFIERLSWHVRFYMDAFFERAGSWDRSSHCWRIDSRTVPRVLDGLKPALESTLRLLENAQTCRRIGDPDFPWQNRFDTEQKLLSRVLRCSDDLGYSETPLMSRCVDQTETPSWVDSETPPATMEELQRWAASEIEEIIVPKLDARTESDSKTRAQRLHLSHLGRVLESAIFPRELVDSELTFKKDPILPKHIKKGLPTIIGPSNEWIVSIVGAIRQVPELQFLLETIKTIESKLRRNPKDKLLKHLVNMDREIRETLRRSDSSIIDPIPFGDVYLLAGVGKHRIQTLKINTKIAQEHDMVGIWSYAVLRPILQRQFSRKSFPTDYAEALRVIETNRTGSKRPS